MSSWPRECRAPGCEAITWKNPTPVAVMLQPVRDGARIGLLIGKRAIEPKHGGWACIGGHIEDNGEDVFTAARREMMEETGLESPGELRLFDSEATGRGQLLIFCEALLPLDTSALDDAVLCPENSALDVAWSPDVELCFPIHQKMMTKWFAQQEYRDDYFVSGGIYTGTDFVSLEPGTEECYGPFPTMERATTEWSARSRAKIDICTHRLMITRGY